MKFIAPKGTIVEHIGEKASNVTRGWYIRGGTFCSKCRLKYTFKETYTLYLRVKQFGRNGPRCPYCNQMVRTRAKSKPLGMKEGFWWRMENNV